MSLTMQTHADISWVQIVIPAAAALLGVGVGGLISIHSQKLERRQQHIREQLQNFYSVLLGMRSNILAKSELRVKFRNKGRAIERDLRDAQNSQEQRQSLNAKWQEFEKSMEYDNHQLVNDLVPMYREMLAHFTKNMWLAEPSTLAHYKRLVEYVEIWNRGLSKAIPTDVMFEIKHSETDLYPFYEDLESQFKRLQKELSEPTDFWARTKTFLEAPTESE